MASPLTSPSKATVAVSPPTGASMRKRSFPSSNRMSLASQERIKIIRENRLVVFECLRPFKLFELGLRKQIMDVALNLEVADRLEQGSLLPDVDDEDGMDDDRLDGEGV
jgi:hypothetical protein